MKAWNRPALAIAVLVATGVVSGWALAEDGPSWPADAASPYLAGHAEDGIRWQSWEAERPSGRLAFVVVGRFGSARWQAGERAFLTMPETREALERWFVPVLVDGEERPDLVELCRLAARLGSELPAESLDGPLGAILTPAGRPVVVRPLTPALARSLERWALEYRELPGDVEARAGVTAAQLAITTPPPAGPVDRAQLVAHVLRGLRDSFDARNGGFGTTPQRPPYGALRFLLAEAARAGNHQALRMATRTLDAIVQGAIHDHVGGGFFHATSDSEWQLPRFEKTLTDNALLLDVLVEAHALTGKALYRDAAVETADWILRALRKSGEDAFVNRLASGELDDEGRFYRLSQADIGACLGEAKRTALERDYHLAPTGLLLPRPGGALADAAARERLRECRAQRPAPAADSRAFVSANGLALGALAASGKAFRRQGDLDAAERAARAIVDSLGPLPELRRFGPHGASPRSAQLADYADLAWGLAQLSEATGETRWAELGVRVVDAASERFLDAEAGGFFATDASDRPLSVRLKPFYETDAPSADGMMSEALVRLARLTGHTRLRAIAEGALTACAGDMQRVPRGLESMALVITLLEPRPPSLPDSGPRPVVTTGAPQATIGPVDVTARVVNPPVRPGHFVDVEVSLRIAAPFVLPSARPLDRDLVPTSVAVLDPDLPVEQIRYPDGVVERRSFSAQPVRLYSGQVSVVVTLRVPRGARPGPHPLRLRVRFQACGGSDCRPPEDGILEVPMSIAPSL